MSNAQPTTHALDAVRLLDALGRHVPGVIYVLQRWADGRLQFHYVSDSVGALLGCTPADVIARPALVAACIHADDRHAFADAVAAAFAAGAAWAHAFRIVLPGRGVRHLVTDADATLQPDGSIVWYGHVADVTASRLAGQKHDEVVERYEHAIEQIGDGMWFYDALDDRFSFSQSWWATLGYDVAEADRNQMSWIERIDPVHQQAVLDATNALIDGRTDVLSVEYRIRTAESTWRWLHARGAVTERTDDGRARILAGTFSDITARKDSEQRIREQAHVIEAAPIGLLVADAAAADFPLLYINPAGRALFNADAQGDAPVASLPALSDDPQAYADSLAADVIARRTSRRLWLRESAGGEFAWLRITTTPTDIDTDHPRVIGVVKDISDDFRMHERLVRAHEDAGKASEAKSRFVAHVSHELRTPLHGIMGLSELTAADVTAPRKVRDNAYEIHRAAQHLLKLIADVIDLSAMEAGRLALSPETVEVARIIDNVMHMAQPVAHDAGIALAADPRLRETLHVRADSTRVAQVLLNLVSNGIKYNRAGGKVTLKLLDGPAGMVRIGVEDSGEGLGADAVAQLFDQFNRLGREMSSIEGSGIGLTIARSLAEAMGGALGVSSTPGEGSLFWLDLPRAPSPPRGERAPLAATAAPRAELGVLHVLVAEDNLLSQAVFRSQIEKLGCLATIASDGIEAWALWEIGSPDVLLTDVHMPGVDGFELVRRIRAAEAASGQHRTYVVGVSANALKEAERNALLHGMDAYATKPLTLEALREVLARSPANQRRRSPPLRPASTESAYDTRVLDIAELTRYVGDDPMIIESFFEQFVVTVTKDIAALQSALRARDDLEATEIAHRLKSTAATAGAFQLADVCAAIERAGRSGDEALGERYGIDFDGCAERLSAAIAARQRRDPA